MSIYTGQRQSAKPKAHFPWVMAWLIIGIAVLALGTAIGVFANLAGADFLPATAFATVAVATALMLYMRFKPKDW